VNQGCGGTFNVSSGEIQSLDINSDGFYEPNLDCSWYINSNNLDEILVVTFERFDLEPSPNNTCVYDYVEVSVPISFFKQNRALLMDQNIRNENLKPSFYRGVAHRKY
ncbi:cubilin, partial [Nephila pilipes]